MNSAGIHVTRSFLSNFHASRKNFSTHHASRINPLPPHFGTGSRCRPLNLGFDTKVSAILATAVDIVDIDDVKASKVTELLEVSE